MSFTEKKKKKKKKIAHFNWGKADYPRFYKEKFFCGFLLAFLDTIPLLKKSLL